VSGRGDEGKEMSMRRWEPHEGGLDEAVSIMEGQ